MSLTGGSYIDDHDISKEKEYEKDTIVRNDVLLSWEIEVESPVIA